MVMMVMMVMIAMVAVVIGDGRTPRTAALLSMRTKWHVISIDPALHGLEPPPPSDHATREHLEAVDVASTSDVEYASLPKELRHPRLKTQEQTDRAKSKRAKMREGLGTLERLTIMPLKVQDSTVCLSSGSSTDPPDGAAAYGSCSPSLSPHGHVIIVLPHAHVTPDDALRCLRFDEGALAAHTMSGRRPLISVVQLPCCGYVFHDLAINGAPDFDFMDARIATSARCVRVWRDVASRFDFSSSMHGRGVPKRAQNIAFIKARRRAAQASDRE